MSVKKKKMRATKPVHPGQILREDFMPDRGLTVMDLAAAIGTSRQTVNELVRERRAMTPVMALKLGRFFGNTAEFWLDVQRDVDLREAQKAYGEEIKGIKPHRATRR